MRKAIIGSLFGFNADNFDEISKKVTNLETELKNQTTKVDALEARLSRINNLGDSAFNILKSQRDNLDSLRNKLWTVRESSDYGKVFKNKTPLVSVRIATYNNADKLVNVAVKSVLNQTYQNFEIIIIGDHCTDDTEEKIKKINDPRIIFINLPYRSVYPEDAYNRWLVAGSPGMNLGAHLAKGEWIAPLDDDDEFSPDHIEKLLALALKEKAEFAYGAIMQKNSVTHEKRTIYAEIPKFGEFSFQSVIYLKSVSFFEYDQQSWVVGEPGDWNLCRRMLLSGVRIASTSDIVTTIHMTPLAAKKK